MPATTRLLLLSATFSEHERAGFLARLHPELAETAVEAIPLIYREPVWM